MQQKRAIVIGAGIVGLAAARALALQGYRVDVLEKSEKAVGASIRNFGAVWPLGQPAGPLLNRAMRSAEIWKDILVDGNFWHSPKGSILLAYEADELNTIEEFVDINASERNVRLLNVEEVKAMSPAVNTEGLKGGLFSADEVIIDPREVIAGLPQYFMDRLSVHFHFLTPATRIEYPYVYSGNKKFTADEIYVCSGQEFESLYNELYMDSPLVKCKLQMMRTVAQPDLVMGPALVGGLTLMHYESFRECPSLKVLAERIHCQYPEYLEHGIHVMATQNGSGEVVIGDSHEYGFTHDPFDKEHINRMILEYLHGMVTLPNWRIQHSWHGVYVKMVEGTELVLRPEDGVTIVNGLGGGGMTMSFALMEEVVSGTYKA